MTLSKNLFLKILSVAIVFFIADVSAAQIVHTTDSRTDMPIPPCALLNEYNQSVVNAKEQFETLKKRLTSDPGSLCRGIITKSQSACLKQYLETYRAKSPPEFALMAALISDASHNDLKNNLPEGYGLNEIKMLLAFTEATKMSDFYLAHYTPANPNDRNVIDLIKKNEEIHMTNNIDIVSSNIAKILTNTLNTRNPAAIENVDTQEMKSLRVRAENIKKLKFIFP